jgi:putative DNA primase/helicase
MIDAQTISEALGGKRSGSGFLSRCPAHDDRDPSLRISDGDNGKPVVKCHAGCDQKAVIAALQEKGLWPESEKKLSKQELEAIQQATRAKQTARLAEQRKRHNQAADKAKKILASAKGDPSQHPYAIAKGVNYGRLVKRGPWEQRGWDDALIIPLYDASGSITTLTAINIDGTKDLLAGGKKDGSFYPFDYIIKKEKGPVVIGEGLATVAAVVDVIHCPGVMAVDAGNMVAVAKAVRHLAPTAKIIIIADDDRKDDGSNPGMAAARSAALAVGGLLAAPALGRKADAWDLWKEKGAEAIKEMIDKATIPTNKKTEPAPARVKLSDQPGLQVFDGWLELPGEGKIKPGVWYFKNRSGKGDDPDTLVKHWICSPIHVLAVTSDRQENNFGRLLRFVNTNGNWREWAMPMELLRGSCDDLRGQLLSMGVEIDPKAKNDLALYLQSQHPKRRAYCALRVGWYDGSFVLPNSVIGPAADDVIFQSGDKEHDSKYGVAGTLEGWKKSIAGRAVGNDYLTLALSASFAGPLLEKTHVEGGGFHFVGDSSIGKSTAITAACSVWGGKEFMSSWKATANGMEGAAALSNDCMLALDEIGECEAKEIGGIIYALGNGRGKQRSNRVGAARTVAQWRCVVMSSGERTVETIMAEAGQRIKAGHTVRLPDIWIEPGKYGAWDNIHGAESGTAFTDEIKKASVTNYGHSGREFLKKLVADQTNFVETLDRVKALAEFSGGTDGQAKRVACKFALYAMAGELATQYGLTGWEEGAAIKAAAKCFNSWLTMRGSLNDETKQIIDQLTGFIDRHGDSRFSDSEVTNADKSVKINRAGWWSDSIIYGSRVFCFNAAALREALIGFDFKRALDTLQHLEVLPPSGPKGERARGHHFGGHLTKYYEINADKLASHGT